MAASQAKPMLSHHFNAALLTALLAATLLLTSTDAAAYPNCPLTGKPPTKPGVVPTRCVAAQQLSCCSDCSDLNYAVQSLAINVTAATEAAFGGFLDLSTVPSSICPIMKGHELCQSLMEQLVCAVKCNPDSGNYITGNPGKYMLQICADHAQQIYNACSSLEFAGFVLGETFATSDDLIQQALVPLISAQIPGFNATVAKTACYAGPTVMPITPLCCDPLTIPPTCPPGSVNITAAKDISGRPLDKTLCADFPYSNATTPFPPNGGPASPPSAAAPSPPSAAAPSLPAAAPPSPPLTPAPSPLPTPTPASPPAPAPAPTPASPPPSPTPAPPSSPPPPKGAGAGGASLIAAALPLAVVLMAVV